MRKAWAARARAAAGIATLALVLAAQPSAAWAGATLGWRMDGNGAFPDADPPLEWSTSRDVAWATPMPSWSNASPVLVQDRVLVASEPDRLLCVRKSDGALLWERANPLADAIPAPSPRPAMLDAMTATAKTAAALGEEERELTRLRHELRRAPDETALQSRIEALAAQVAKTRHLLGSLLIAKPEGVTEATGFSSPTPVTDGKVVYALFGTGVAASYDADGRRRWIRYLDHSQVGDGAASSPVLVGDTLVVSINELMGLDAATGAVRWRAPVPYRPGTPAAVRIGDVDVVVTPTGHCVRVADGEILASGIGNLDFASPVVQDGVLYMIAQPSRAFRIPTALTEPLAFEPLWSARVKGERYYASPLVAGGLVYAITRGQILNVLDAASGELVYATRLKLGWAGASDSVFSSPTLGGGHVFVSGFSGTTAVVPLGRTFAQVASNELEKFRSCPVFEGSRIYVRGATKLWCLAKGARP